MKKYRVKITGRALRDMEAIYDYIACRLASPTTAMRQYNRIAEGIQSLAVFPERYPLFGSSVDVEREMRQILVDRYSAVYTIRGDEVVVLRVLYSASDLASRLRDLQ